MRFMLIPSAKKTGLISIEEHKNTDFHVSFSTTFWSRPELTQCLLSSVFSFVIGWLSRVHMSTKQTFTPDITSHLSGFATCRLWFSSRSGHDKSNMLYFQHTKTRQRLSWWSTLTRKR